MHFETIKPDHSISLFVKNILVFEEQEKDLHTVLPFFADGYPGLIFQETNNGLLVRPHNKQMPVLFLYGQTIHPIELHIKGSYKLIIFQLFPFVLKSFFNITAKDINDGCYNLEQLENGSITVNQLLDSSVKEKRIDILSSLLSTIFQAKKDTLDFKIRQAVQIIIDGKGQTGVKQVCSKMNITERTLERRFSDSTGITAKQFSKIIQFQQSLAQITVKDYNKLSDIVYSNGYADQSHFIKVFKAFTGKTPKNFTKKAT